MEQALKTSRSNFARMQTTTLHRVAKEYPNKHFQQEEHIQRIGIDALATQVILGLNAV